MTDEYRKTNFIGVFIFVDVGTISRVAQEKVVICLETRQIDRLF